MPRGSEPGCLDRSGPVGRGLRRQPIIGRFRRLTGCGRIIELPVSGRLLGLHAHTRRAEIPDPDSRGQLPKTSPQLLGVSSSQYERACQNLLTNTGGSFEQQAQQCEDDGVCPQALVQQMLTAQRKFARCMRSHGLPNFPAPVVDSRGRPAISVRPWVVGFDADSGLFANLEKGCEDVMHPLVAPPLVVYLPPTARAADRQWDRRAPYEEKRNEK
jgi:hypothetical protein